MATEEKALSVYQPMQADVALHRPPEKVLAEAHQAARALKDVVDKKEKPVRFNNETYLEFEDWQTLGRFYGITAKVSNTSFVQYDKVSGFEASADALLVATGQVISSADAMCLNDENNWRSKPMFQLRSMAQTRACAKALRNVLAWVVVLAGYRPTPAEEMDEVFHKSKPKAAPPPTDSVPITPEEAFGFDPSEPHDEPPPSHTERKITEPQRKRLYAIAMGSGLSKDQFKEEMVKMGFKSSADVTMDQYEDLCTYFQNQKGQ